MLSAVALGTRSLVGSFLLLLALALFGAGWSLTGEDRAFLFDAALATGTVVAHESYAPEGRKPRQRYRLVVSFATGDGARIRFRSVASYGRPPYAVGSPVPVRYRPEQPTRARVDRRMESVVPLMLWSAAVLLIGTLGIAIAWFGPRPAR